MSLPRWLIFILGIAAFGVGAAGFGLWGATRAPRIVTYSVDDPRWPETARPLRIVLLSDTHAAGPDMPVVRLEGIVAQANALRPDLVALTGDYVSDKTLRSDTVAAADAIAPFRHLRARLGVFAVLGNHDHWRDGAALASALRNAGVRVLANEHVTAGPIVVAGIDDEFTGHADLVRALGGIDHRRPTLLLSHSPDIFPSVDSRITVTLAGHTHGGQIVLPWIGPLATASRHGRRYAHGQIVEAGRHLIVSAGLGTSILPMRIGMPPEIVVIEIR